MEIKRAIITAASKSQRTLPLQNVVDRDGNTKTALRILIEEILAAGIEEICIVVCPGDQAAYTAAADGQSSRLQFVEQTAPLGGFGAEHDLALALQALDDRRLVGRLADAADDITAGGYG